MRRLLVTIGIAAVGVAGCDDELCPLFDYTPPSLRFTLTDSTTGDDLCGLAVEVADMRLVIAHETPCNYEMPDWWDPDLGQTAVLSVSGYEDRTVTLPVPDTNDCGEILAPAPDSFELTPTP